MTKAKFRREGDALFLSAKGALWEQLPIRATPCVQSRCQSAMPNTLSDAYCMLEVKLSSSIRTRVTLPLAEQQY
jgi:hypothetical protein